MLAGIINGRIVARRPTTTVTHLEMKSSVLTLMDLPFRMAGFKMFSQNSEDVTINIESAVEIIAAIAPVIQSTARKGGNTVKQTVGIIISASPIAPGPNMARPTRPIRTAPV